MAVAMPAQPPRRVEVPPQPRDEPRRDDARHEPVDEPPAPAAHRPPDSTPRTSTDRPSTGAGTVPADPPGAPEAVSPAVDILELRSGPSGAISTEPELLRLLEDELESEMSVMVNAPVSEFGSAGGSRDRLERSPRQGGHGRPFRLGARASHR